MAQTEEVVVLQVKTIDAVESVNDLKNNIKLLKEQLGDAKIGTQEYTDTLNELKTNQNALKDAMYATSASLDSVIESATGASNSYNSLVHRMAALKEEWRATNEEARRNELAEQIAAINTELKEMDASIGNFQRNVGNYESGLTGFVAKFQNLGETLGQMPPTLGAVGSGIANVGNTMKLIGKEPILAIIGLLVPIIMKITDSLKDNKTAMDAVKKVMAAFQPLFDAWSGVLELIAQGLSDVADWLIELIGNNGGMSQFTEKAVALGNVLIQSLIAPIKAAISGWKGFANIMKDVFEGNFGQIKTHAKEAWDGVKSAWQEGFSFKQNYEKGLSVGEQFAKGLKDRKDKAKEAGEEMAKAFNEGFNEWQDEQRALADEEAYNQEYAAQLEATEALQQGLNERLWNGLTQRLEMQEAYSEALEAAKQEEAAMLKEIEEEEAQYRIETLMSVADATSSILSSIADMMEADEKNAEKNAKKIKALRIASATIDMLNGAVGAFAQASATIPPPYGQIVGAASAAAVIAMGAANIAKIKSTSFNGGGGGGASAASAVVSPPNVETDLQSVRTITTASEEERLNRMASSQKVYILQSDIEAANNQSKAQVAESSF